MISSMLMVLSPPPASLEYYCSRVYKDTSAHDSTLSLLPQNLLDLADLFLNFAGYLFTCTFGFQLGIIGDFPGYFLDLALRFVKRAFHFVLHA